MSNSKEANGIAFVTGLPRTRSAWWAALINAHRGCPTEQAYHEAYHELLSKCETLEEYKEWLTGGRGVSVDCSSRIDYIEGSKMLVVQRDIIQVAKSLMKLPLYAASEFVSICNTLELAYEALRLQWQKARRFNNLMFVNYEALDQTNVICECLEFLGITPDQQVIEYMQEFNIQAQYLKSITPKEFNLMGTKINSMFELRMARLLTEQMENKDERIH